MKTVLNPSKIRSFSVWEDEHENEAVTIRAANFLDAFCEYLERDAGNLVQDLEIEVSGGLANLIQFWVDFRLFKAMDVTNPQEPCAGPYPREECDCAKCEFARD